MCKATCLLLCKVLWTLLTEKLHGFCLFVIIRALTLTLHASAKATLWSWCPVSRLGKVLAVGLRCCPSVPGKRCKVVKTTSLLCLLLHGFPSDYTAVLSCKPYSHLSEHISLMSGYFPSCQSHLRAWLWTRLICVAFHLSRHCLVVLHVFRVPRHPHFLHLSPAPLVPLGSPGHREACDEPILRPGRRGGNIYCVTICSNCDT